MRLIKRFTIADRKCIILNYANDNRYCEEGMISTHDKYIILLYYKIAFESNENLEFTVNRVGMPNV
jgi:hypothetical protein